MTGYAAAAALLMLAASMTAEPVLDKFPFLLRAGVQGVGEPGLSGELTLPDVPFSLERGFGHVGGAPGRRIGAMALGGDVDWLLAWREAMEKYVFRLPPGEYVVELTFLETDVAASGLRVFDVFVEDAAFKGFDIAREGGDFAWVTLATRVGVLDGWLDLRFESRTSERAPRISRIRVLRATDSLAASPPIPALTVLSGPGAVLLEWTVPAGSVVGSYEVLRSQSPAGLFVKISTNPVHIRRFLDTTIEVGTEHFYRVRAHRADGSGSVDSGVQNGKAKRVEDLGLQVMDVRVSEESLRSLGVQSNGPIEVPAELHWQGDVRHVLLSLEKSTPMWQRKKSFRLVPQVERNRSIRRRKSLFLSAEAGDPTLLRESLSSTAALAVGLASPAVEPVALSLNGVYQGVYFDIEPLGRRFRSRFRLDRVGLLARETRGDRFEWDWVPHGEQRGEEGNLMALTELVQELNRLDEGEIQRFFEDRLYLERWLDRTALSLIRGAPLLGRFLLQDSRNQRWELFEEKSPNDSLGISDFETRSAPLGVAASMDLLESRTLSGKVSNLLEPSVLETRLLMDPRRREQLSLRLSTMISGALAPERFDELVDAGFAKVREAALCDPNRWPRDGGEALLSGPRRIKADHRARVAALRELDRGLKVRRPPKLLLNEVLLRPKGGEPWIEVQNFSSESSGLAGCYITTEFHRRAIRFPLPAPEGGALEPGQRFLWRRDSGSVFPALGADGGFLALWQQATPTSPSELLDSIFLGRQTEGFAYGRDAEGAWGFLSNPTPAMPNLGAALRPPPHEYRQGVTREKNGDLKIWLKLRWDDLRGDQGPAKVALQYREEGAAEFQGVDLAWDDKGFQFVIHLAAAPNRKRTAYYFLARSAEGVERVFPLAAPRLTFILPVEAPVRLNEVLPRPGRAAGAPGEFIEVFNTSDSPFELEGCFLSDSSRNPTRWRIPGGNVVPPRGFAVFWADGANRGNHAGFKLSNSGEFLGLYGRMEEGNLPIDTITFRSVQTGASWGANPDGTKQFRIWKDPTPGSRNIPKIPGDYLKRQSAALGGARRPDEVTSPLAPPETAPPELRPEPDEDDEDEDAHGIEGR